MSGHDMSGHGLDGDLQPRTTNSLAPAQSAIRFCLARLPEFLAFAKGRFGADYPPGFFDDVDATIDDLTEGHNVIGRLIDEATS